MTAHPLWLRRVDPRWHRDFTARVDGLASRAARAARDPVAEATRIRTAAVRAGRIVEHGRDWTEAMELAESPLDLSAAGPSWLAEKARMVVKHRPRAKLETWSEAPRPPQLPRAVPRDADHPDGLETPTEIMRRRSREQREADAALTRRASALPYDRSRPRGFVASLQRDGTYTFTDRTGLRVPGLAMTASGVVVEDATPERSDELSAAGVVAFGETVVGFARELARRR